MGIYIYIYRVYIGFILAVHGGNEKENGNYCNNGS